MIETNGFQILNTDILTIIHDLTVQITHAQRDAQKHCFI